MAQDLGSVNSIGKHSGRKREFSLIHQGQMECKSHDNCAATPTPDMATMHNMIIEMQSKISDMQTSMRLQNDKIQRQSEKIAQLEEDSSYLESKCWHLERHLEHFRFWEYMAPDIHPSHWESLGLDERQTKSMNDYLKSLKTQVYDIRNGDCDGKIELHGSDRCYWDRWWKSTDRPRSSLLPYYDILQPHWKEIAEAMLHCAKLLQQDRTKGPSFEVVDITLSRNILDILVEALTQIPFIHLRFENNDISHFFFTPMGSYFTKLVKSNPNLETFILADNPCLQPKDVDTMRKVIRQHPSFKTIELRRCMAMDCSINICSLVTASKSMKAINLCGNGLAMNGSTLIADFLATNPALERLDLSCNKLNDEDSIRFATALGSNTNLHSLNLMKNNITEISHAAFFKMIFNPLSLNTVHDSNHTCEVTLQKEFVLFRKVDLKIPWINSGEYAWLARLQKLLALLSSPDEDHVHVNHLQATPHELMPNVLHFVQRYPETKFWCFMSEMRPDVSNEEEEEFIETVVDGEEGRDGEDNEEDFEPDHYHHMHDEEMDETEEDLKKKEEEEERRMILKRFNILFEVLRGCTMQVFCK